MRMKLLTSVVAAILLSSAAYAADKDAGLSVEDAVRLVGKRGSFPANSSMSPFELQVFYRLRALERH